MTLTPQELRAAYREFFWKSEAGKHFISQLNDQIDRNMNTAAKENSLDYLSRYKGNKEVFELIDNVTNYKVKGEPEN